MLVLLASTPVLAQGSPRREWLSIGELAFAQGRFGDALDAFEASYRDDQAPQTLRRIGDAADKLGSHARAAEVLQAYLRVVPDAPDRELIAARIDANHAALAPVHPRTVDAESAAMTAPSDQQHGQSGAAVAPPLAADNLSKSERTSAQPAGPLWLWVTGGAVAVAGIVIAAVVIGSAGSPGSSDPLQGNVGGAIQTLGSR